MIAINAAIEMYENKLFMFNSLFLFYIPHYMN